VRLIRPRANRPLSPTEDIDIDLVDVDCDERDLFEPERSPTAVLLSRLSKSGPKPSSVGIWGSEGSRSCDRLRTECELVMAAAVVVLLIGSLAKQ
jgi:hypothetical protein